MCARPRDYRQKHIPSSKDIYNLFVQDAVASYNKKHAKNVALEFDAYDCVIGMEYPSSDELAEMDALMITGGNDAPYGNEEWILKMLDFIRMVHRDFPHIKMIGFCFGHQILARAFGGVATENPEGYELGVTQVSLSPEGVRFFHKFGAADSSSTNDAETLHVKKPRIPRAYVEQSATSDETDIDDDDDDDLRGQARYGNSVARINGRTLRPSDLDPRRRMSTPTLPLLAIHQFHRQHVEVAPPHFQTLGSSAKTAQQIHLVEGRLLSFQGHPEFNAALMRKLLHEYVKPEGHPDFPRILSSLNYRHDGASIGRRVVEFILLE